MKFEWHACGDQFSVTFMYPDRDGDEKVYVGLCDVRAADDIRLHFDFQRDGWVVQQASRFDWDAKEYDEIVARGEDPHDWQEVAFIKAWGRQKR